MAEVKKQLRPKTARNGKPQTVLSEEIGKPITQFPNKRRTKTTLPSGINSKDAEVKAKELAAAEIQSYINAITSEKIQLTSKDGPNSNESVDKVTKKSKETVVATVQTPRFNEKVVKTLKRPMTSPPSKTTKNAQSTTSASMKTSKSQENKSGSQSKKKATSKSARKSESSHSVILEEIKLAIARSRKENSTELEPKKVKSGSKTSRKERPASSETKTVLPARPFSKDSKMSVQLMELTKELNDLAKNKKETRKKSMSSRTSGFVKTASAPNSVPSTPKRPSTAQPASTKNKASMSARTIPNSAPSATKRPATAQPSSTKSQAALSARSIRASNSETRVKKAKQKLSLEHLDQTPKEKVKPDKTLAKKVEKTKQAKGNEERLKFLDKQDRDVEEQILHLVKLQDKLEREIVNLMESLESEHSRTKVVSGQCCCTPDTKLKLQNLLQKQRNIITLQTDLRKRYGFNLTTETNSGSNDVILDGLNIPFKMLTSLMKETDKKVTFFCKVCHVSCSNDLAFRAHLESPEHVVKAYKEIHKNLPIFKCEKCDASLKGTTKYMNHVINDIHHKPKTPNTFRQPAISVAKTALSIKNPESEAAVVRLPTAATSGSGTKTQVASPKESETETDVKKAKSVPSPSGTMYY